MYKKIARIGPISFGIFYALITLLMVIIVVLLGAFVLPLIPMGEGVPQMDGIRAATEVIASGEGLAQMAMGLGMMLLVSFIIGLIGVGYCDHKITGTSSWEISHFIDIPVAVGRSTDDE